MCASVQGPRSAQLMGATACMSSMQAVVRHLGKELMKISWGVLLVGRTTNLQLLLVGDAQNSATTGVSCIQCMFKVFEHAGKSAQGGARLRLHRGSHLTLDNRLGRSIFANSDARKPAWPSSTPKKLKLFSLRSHAKFVWCQGRGARPPARAARRAPTPHVRSGQGNIE